MVRANQGFGASTLACVAFACALLLPASGAQAALFEDTDARRAILDIRGRIDEMSTKAEQDHTQLRRNLLDMQTQIESLTQELAVLRGQNERLQQAVSELQQSNAAVDSRLRQFEPAKITLDGLEFEATPEEQRAYDEAFSAFRSNNFSAAQAGFQDLLKKYPQTGYRLSALFWLGNAEYANRNYKDAITHLRALTSAAPNHVRAAEAALAIANCQIELKDVRAARQTLEDLIKAYPNSEAAVPAKERLARLRS